MTNPLYRVRASGFQGSGYARPPLPGEKSKLVTNADGIMIEVAIDDTGKAITVPGVTTVTGMGGDPGGLVQWSVDQTAAYAVANVDSLLSRTQDQGWGFLRFYHKRKPDLSDPLRTAHQGVLDDLAELGTGVHEYVEWDLLGAQGFPPPIDSEEMQQMVDAYYAWKFLHDIEVVAVELTVYGDGYAGTLDLILRIDGKLYLLDIKTARAVRDSHWWQLAALDKADVFYVETDTDVVGQKVWVPQSKLEHLGNEEDWHYGFLHTRPNDIEKDGTLIPAFFELEEIPAEDIEIHYESFLACLTLRRNQKIMKARTSERKKENNG